MKEIIKPKPKISTKSVNCLYMIIHFNQEDHNDHCYYTYICILWKFVSRETQHYSSLVEAPLKKKHN